MPGRAPRLLPLSAIPAAIRQIAAVAAIGAIGTTALAAAQAGTPASVTPVAASVAAPAHHRVESDRPAPGPLRGSPATPAPKPAAKSRVAAPARHAAPRTPQRWVPAGTGMWIYQWGKSSGGNATAVVARARGFGLTHVFVRTGSTHDGYTGAGVLHALLPATARTNLRVIAWDFPELKRPARDARRLARAAWEGRRGSGPHVAAVAPDIETRAEGTHTSAVRVARYLSTLRRYLPADVAILTTVPWPSSARVGHYPYATVAQGSEALLPMAYWYDNSPGRVTRTSIAFLSRFHKPVQPVGQGYDGKLDVPSLRHNNLRKQVPTFLATAHAMGADAVSVWSWQAAPWTVWQAIARARAMFPARR